jgi:membrane fusion protein (multidrug efflux system)
MSFATRLPPRTIRLVAYGVILAVAIWACVRLFADSNSETTNDAYVTADFTLVAPRVAGQLSEVLVEDNQQVKAGQLMVRIDDRDFKAALMSAEADVTAEKASVANYEAEIARQPSLVD